MMGNQSCYLLGQDCLSSCFSNRYFSWKNDTPNQHSQLENFDEYPRASVSELLRRNRISEYIAHALSRSRSPLLLHDEFLPSDSSPLGAEFPANNTTSWMSDATRSDASHRLYREVDPSFTGHQHRLTGRGMDSSYQLATPTSIGDDEDDEDHYYGQEVEEGGRAAALAGGQQQEEVGGGWVAVARLSSSGSHKRTSTSAIYLPSATSLTNALPPLLPIRRPCPPGQAHPLGCTGAEQHEEEEVDNLELARVARGLWTGGERTSLAGSTKGNRSHRQPVTRPSVLNLSRRLGSEVGHKQCPPYRRQPQTLPQRTAVVMDPSILNGDEDSPAELDWDHEPGTASAVTHLKSRSGVGKGRVYPPGSSYRSSTMLDYTDISDTELGSAFFVHPRPSISSSAAGRVSRTTGQCIRSTVSDGVEMATGAGLSVKYTVSDIGETAEHLPDELVDSGFVGLMNSSTCGSGGGATAVGGDDGGGAAADGQSEGDFGLVAG